MSSLVPPGRRKTGSAEAVEQRDPLVDDGFGREVGSPGQGPFLPRAPEVGMPDERDELMMEAVDITLGDENAPLAIFENFACSGLVEGDDR